MKAQHINTSGESSKDPKGTRAGVYSAPSYDLFNGATQNILQGINQAEPPESNQGNSTGINRNNYQVIPQPFSFCKTIALKDISTHHAACIQSKKYSTVGLGFYGEDEISGSDTTISDLESEIAQAQKNTTVRDVVSLLTGNQKVNSKVDDLLDPLTYFGFQNELMDMTEDFMDVGTGYLEVARDSEENITGIRHVPVADLRPVIQGPNLFYLYKNPNGTDRYFAMYGQKDWLMANYPGGGTGQITREEVSEIIPFLMPSNRVKFYGYPDWLSAVVDIDLTAMSKQYKADFYSNRGVLDFMVSVTGTSMDDKQWSTLEGIVKGSVGAGRNFKSGVLNVSNENAKVQVDKLAMDMNTEEQFAKDNEVLSQNIVSAHRVPPLLANILIPGKLGASNEFVNALIGYQLLVIGPYQQIIQSQLGRTLGDQEHNGGLDLSADSFRLRTLTSQINITGLDAVSRSRSEAVTEEDRDFSEGVLE